MAMPATVQQRTNLLNYVHVLGDLAFQVIMSNGKEKTKF
jgi:hypothetical protein